MRRTAESGVMKMTFMKIASMQSGLLSPIPFSPFESMTGHPRKKCASAVHLFNYCKMGYCYIALWQQP